MKWYYHDLDHAYDDDDGRSNIRIHNDQVNINKSRYIIFLCRKLIGVFYPCL